MQEHVDNILVYLQGTSELEQRIDKTVKIYCLDYKGIINLPQTLWKLRNIIREEKVDIIHSHLTPTSFYANLARPKHVPQLHTVHIAYSTDRETRPFLRFLERQFLFYKSYCNLALLSEFTKADFLRTVPFKGRAFVLNNFIDDSFFEHPAKIYTGTAARELRIIAIGNFREQKNYGYLLDMFKELKQYPVQLDIYGGGDTEKYQQDIHENGLKITLKGPTKNINAIISNYDLFIMPSTNEGFPLSVFEAMAAGVPLMLSNIEPLQAIVKEHAVYFELNNAPKAAAQIIEVLLHTIDIDAMAVRAKAYAELTVRRSIYMKNLLGIYKELI